MNLIVKAGLGAVIVGALLACGATSDPNPGSSGKAFPEDSIITIYVGQLDDAPLHKFCDGPNLIYYHDTAGHGLAVSPKDPACIKATE